jgi:hypothetical protein
MERSFPYDAFAKLWWTARRGTFRARFREEATDEA